MVDCNADGQTVWVDVKNKFTVGDRLELMTPQGNVLFQLDEMENKIGEKVEVAPGSGHRVKVQLPRPLNADMGLLMKNLARPIYT